MAGMKMQAGHADIDMVFRKILPTHSREEREGQIKLCHDMFDAMAGRKIALCDAGVGIGKTDAYLVAAVLFDKHFPIDERINDYYGADNKRYPFMITTSSIALQKAILEEYIPFLSDVLHTSGMIESPFAGQIQKGKENYVCRQRLIHRLATANMDRKKPMHREALLRLQVEKDIDQVGGLSAFDRARVCAPKRCKDDCLDSRSCMYRQYKKSTQQNPALFQVCNHHYFLADGTHWEKGYQPLLPHYRAVIVDEAHQLYDAVQAVCGSEVSHEIVDRLLGELRAMRLNTHANELRAAFDILFSTLSGKAARDMPYRKSSECRKAMWDVLRCLQETTALASTAPRSNGAYGLVQSIGLTLNHFMMGNARYINYVEWDEASRVHLKSVEKSYRQRLQKMLWRKPMGMILTSGTLAAGNDFTFFKDRLGLQGLEKVSETISQSPFDYKGNCLLYFPERMPPTKNTSMFREQAAKQISSLIEKTAGHTLVLCTSYVEMKALFQIVKAMKPAYPLFCMPRRGSLQLDAFRASGNGVLFAAGSCWEGMDFPGDIVSSLIIPRLPFPRRDALHEGQKERFIEVREFVKAVAVPEMQVKLRQGFGRGIRLTTDTCVVSILDGRAAPGAPHYPALMEALPECGQTRSLEMVEAFMRSKKDFKYFMEVIADVKRNEISYRGLTAGRSADTAVIDGT